MKILSAAQTRELDAYTIEHEPIPSIQLMERASIAFTYWFTEHFSFDHPLHIFCGIGNNGGDGMAIARILSRLGYQTQVHWCVLSENTSDDFAINQKRLQKMKTVPIQRLEQGAGFPELQNNPIIIDAIFGAGLNRPVEGYWADLLEFLNAQHALRVAVDVPSGLFADQHSGGTIFKADYTATFQLPKLAFFMAENQEYVGQWEVLDIGLSQKFIDQTDTNYHALLASDVAPLLKKRRKHDHKGTFGHALIVAGSYGKMGACTLCARAALRAGAGLVTMHAPKTGYEILQIAFPEAMVLIDEHECVFTKVEDIKKFNALGVGPGLGTSSLTIKGLGNLLDKASQPLVLDADALNIIARHPDFFEKIPPNSILTPHPREFERLFGKTDNHFEQLARLRQKSKDLNCYIVLKGGNTCIATPAGKCYFSTSGNPGLGTGGTGDVLTGILTGLLAQGYAAEDSCKIGNFVHGLAGDIAAEELEQEALLASDVIAHLGKAFKQLHTVKNRK